MLRNYYTVIFLTLLLGCSAGKELHETDVLVIGGGTGGLGGGNQGGPRGGGNHYCRTDRLAGRNVFGSGRCCL